MKPLLIAVLASAAAALSHSAFAADKPHDNQNENTSNAPRNETVSEASPRAPANKKSEENMDVDAALKEMQTAFESMDAPDSGSSTN